MTSERDGLKAKLRKTEVDLEQIKTENQGFREERDRLRRRVGTLVSYSIVTMNIDIDIYSDSSYWSHIQVTLSAKCLNKNLRLT